MGPPFAGLVPNDAATDPLPLGHLGPQPHHNISNGPPPGYCHQLITTVQVVDVMDYILKITGSNPASDVDCTTDFTIEGVSSLSPFPRAPQHATS